MATLYKLLKEVDIITNEVYKQQLEAELHRKEEFDAAVRIQSWYRGLRTRRQVRDLHQAAVALQRHWRGFVGRARIRQLLSEAVSNMCLKYYSDQAAQIQKTWRGFYVRKYVFDYYSRKKYLESLVEKNELIRTELAEQEQNLLRAQRQREEADTRQRLQQWAQRHHFLVSTVAQPSIFNSPYQSHTMPEEVLLLNTRPATPPRPQQQGGHRYDPGWRQYAAPEAEKPQKLPPLAPRPQGPFRDPAVVQRQRYREFRPSLRVMTDYDCVLQARRQWRREEWAARLHDEVFLPAAVPPKPYQPLLHTATEFGRPAYGSVHFREVQPERHVTDARFRTVVPPVPVFDKLNKEYVETFVEN